MELLKFIIFLQFCSKVHLIDKSLVLVHVIFRHCERTPDIKELYTSSPYYDESNFAPYGYGQLTNEGKNRCYNIGKALRQRYNGFLNASYHHTLVEGRSTDYVRTKESLQLVLAGFFPPTEELIWLEGFNWIPVATYYDKRADDKVLYPLGNSQYIRELQRYIKSQGSESVASKYKDLVKQVSQKIGEPLDFAKMAYFTRGMELLDGLGFKLPEWCYSFYPSPLKDTMVQYFRSTIGTKQLRKYYGGYLLKKIVDDSEMKINRTLDPLNRKIFIYSGHDFNIQILLVLLEYWNDIIPPVGSSLIFEVHNINETYGFKIFYFQNSSYESQPITLPGFGQFVPINELKNWKREFIQLDDLDGNSPSTKVVGNLFLMLSLLYIQHYVSL